MAPKVDESCSSQLQCLLHVVQISKVADRSWDRSCEVIVVQVSARMCSDLCLSVDKPRRLTPESSIRQ